MSGHAPPSRPPRPLALASFAVAWAVLAGTACEGTPQDPSAADEAGLAVAASLPTGSQTGVDDAFGKTDRARVVLLRTETEEAALDRVLDFDPDRETTDVSVRLSLDGPRDFLLTVRLLRGADPLFRGSTLVTLEPGRTNVVDLTLEPVPAGVVIRTDGPLVFQEPGETIQASADVVFATGDPIPSREAQWSSRNPQVLTASPDGLLTAQSSGETHAVAAHLAFRDSILAQVDTTSEFF